MPFEALLEFERDRGQPVGRVYIASRKDDRVPEISEELRAFGVDDQGLFDRLGISRDSLASRRLARNLKVYAERAPDSAEHAFIWKPDFQGSFPLFNFSDLEAQYAAAEAWAAHSESLPLERYLEAASSRSRTR